MSIVDEIRKKIRANGGSAGKVKDIASGVKALETGGSPQFYKINAEYVNGSLTADKTFEEVFELIEAGYTPFMHFYDGSYYYTLYLGYYCYYEDAPYEIEFDGVYESTSKVPYVKIGATSSNTAWHEI